MTFTVTKCVIEIVRLTVCMVCGMVYPIRITCESK